MKKGPPIVTIPSFWDLRGGCKGPQSTHLSKVVSTHRPGTHPEKTFTRWWFQIFFIFTPSWGNDPI